MKTSGFTFLEILITLALVGILATIGLGSFSYFSEKNEQTRIVDELRTAIQFSKVQAIQLGKPLELYPLDAQNWVRGIILKTKKNEVVYQWQWHHPRWNLQWNGVGSGQKITFSHNPVSAISNGTFRLQTIESKLKVELILNRLGRIRIIS